jgi:hypothetical protein
MMKQLGMVADDRQDAFPEGMSIGISVPGVILNRNRESAG